MTAALLAGLISAAGCGSSGSKQVVTPPTNNAATLTAGGGPTGQYLNGVFTSVTVCVPGSTTNCQTIDGVLVDTGSYGLRLLSSAGGGKFSLTLPQETLGSDPIAECIQFLGNAYIWGPVKTADIQIAGEKASSVPVHVIGDPAFSTVPAGCSNGGTAANDLTHLAANGILGIGPFQEDCGLNCANGIPQGDPYYRCPSSGCQQAAVPLAQQVPNPVALFATDNNGTIMELPTVGSSGAVSVTGSLVFGIGTQSNNALGSAQVLTLDGGANFKSFAYKGVTYSAANDLGFLDSGSNAFFYLDSPTTGLATCPDPNLKDFYCSTQSQSATNTGVNSTSSTVSFNVVDLSKQSLTNNLFSNVAGPGNGGGFVIFDWGLPFFYGRNVYTAIEGKTAPGGTPPYVAY